MKERGVGRSSTGRRSSPRLPQAPTDETAPQRWTFYTVGLGDREPAPGGWAAVGVIDGVEYEESGEDVATTSIRMELTAAMRSLAATKQGCDITVYSYTRVIPQAMKGQIKKWQSAGWRTPAGEPVEHQDLWETLLQSAGERHVEWAWLRVGSAEAGYNNRQSRRALDLARAARRRASSHAVSPPPVAQTEKPAVTPTVPLPPRPAPSSPPAAKIRPAAVGGGPVPVVCPGCGHVNRLQSKFCASCGRPRIFRQWAAKPSPTTSRTEEGTMRLAKPPPQAPQNDQELSRGPSSPREEDSGGATAAVQGVADNGLRPAALNGHDAQATTVADTTLMGALDETKRTLLAECKALERRWAELHEELLKLDPQRQQLVAAIAAQVRQESSAPTVHWAEGARLLIDLSNHARQMARLADEAAAVSNRYSRALHLVMNGPAPALNQPSSSAEPRGNR